MVQVTVSATDSGFHFLGGVGQFLAPDTFFAGPLAGSATAVKLASASGWVGSETLRQPAFGMQLEADAPDNGAALGQSTPITVTAISYWRTEGDSAVEIGRMTLPEPLIVTAYWQTVGPDNTPAWVANLGNSLGAMVAQNGIRFEGGAGDDVFNANTDALYIRGQSVLIGGAGNDVLTGGVGNDIIRGGPGNDILRDTSGTNILKGGAGDDIIYVGAPQGGSTAHGGSGNDVLTSGPGGNFLYGGAGHDKLYGGAGNDHLFGNNGRDILYGGSGDDVLWGGNGNDILHGGDGADTFVFAVGERGKDRILDFEVGVDTVQIIGLTDGMSAVDIVQNGAHVDLHWNGRLQVTLENIDVGNLGADDFSFI